MQEDVRRYEAAPSAGGRGERRGSPHHPYNPRRIWRCRVGYAFGSFLQGDFCDVDVAVLITGEPAPYQAMRFARRIEWELEQAFCYRFEADVKILNTVPISLQYVVIKNGRLVFFRNRERRIRYEAGVLSLYLDYAETLDWFDRVLLTRA